MAIENEEVVEGNEEVAEEEESPEEEGSESVNEEVEENDDEDDDDDDDDDDEDEEDPIDPLDTLREGCAGTKTCSNIYSRFEECEARVNSKSHTEENCSEEILDFFHCQDTCMAKDLMKQLK